MIVKPIVKFDLSNEIYCVKIFEEEDAKESSNKFKQGQRVKVVGTPRANAYINKNGKLYANIDIIPTYIEIIEEAIEAKVERLKIV